MATDITHLLGKTQNGGATPQGKLSADEFNLLVQAVVETQRNIAEMHTVMSQAEFDALEEPIEGKLYLIYEEE